MPEDQEENKGLDKNAPVEEAPVMAKPKSKADMLRTPPEEAREMEKFITSGQNTANITGRLTFLSAVIFALAMAYMLKFDYFNIGDKWVAFVPYMDKMIENQALQEKETYRPREGVTSVPVPQWPRTMYIKLRTDILLLAAVSFCLALIYIHIEKARMKRNDLLLYRSLAREIEKLRARTKDLEKKSGIVPGEDLQINLPKVEDKDGDAE